MKNVYTEERILRSSDVNMYRRLRTSRLFEVLQEISIRHTEELGAGRMATLDKGLLWVVTMQRAQITRMPEFDERIIVKSWPGETMHIIFPRYFVITDEEGEVLISASSIWMLADQETRKIVFPEKYGICIDGISMDEKIELPEPLASKETDHSFEFEVPFSYVDLNGHMNNTRYFDLVEDRVLPHAAEIIPKCISVEYQAELCFGEKAKVQWYQEKNEVSIYGSGTKNYFKMNIKFNLGGENYG